MALFVSNEKSWFGCLSFLCTNTRHWRFWHKWEAQVLWSCVVCAVLWVIWLERNTKYLKINFMMLKDYGIEVVICHLFGLQFHPLLKDSFVFSFLGIWELYVNCNFIFLLFSLWRIAFPPRSSWHFSFFLIFNNILVAN